MPAKKKFTAPLLVYFTPEMKESVDKRAEANGLSSSALVRQIIRQYFSQQGPNNG